MTLLQEIQHLKRTPLYESHLALNGKMVDFSGWELPVYYTSILNEHQWVRQSCGFFDVSHLGEIRIAGQGAFEFLQNRLTCDMSKCKPGKVVYGILCDEDGHSLDDVLVYGAPKGEYFLIVNAANVDKDMNVLTSSARAASVDILDLSDGMACIAVQGPKSEDILQKLFHFKLHGMKYYSYQEERYEDQTVWISRSGYTGEDGFEVFSVNELAPKIWSRLVTEGRSLGALPAGLGARNTLRLEAGNPLYGHELDEKTTPIEAGLRFAVSFDKGDFVGRKKLWEQSQHGTEKKLVGFKMLDRAIPRDGYQVFKDGKIIGSVTSGSFAPTVGCGIGMAYVDTKFSTAGTKAQIEIHGRMAEAELVPRPFVPSKHKK